jgi:hypothetical protein
MMARNKVSEPVLDDIPFEVLAAQFHRRDQEKHLDERSRAEAKALQALLESTIAKWQKSNPESVGLNLPDIFRLCYADKIGEVVSSVVSADFADDDAYLTQMYACSLYAQDQIVVARNRAGKLPLGSYLDPESGIVHIKLKRETMDLQRLIAEKGLATVRKMEVKTPLKNRALKGKTRNSKVS